MKRVPFCFLLVTLMSVKCLVAQDRVRLTVTVSSASGAPVADLRMSDFAIEENGINALRGDIVTYLKDIEVVRYRLGPSGARGEQTTETLDALQEARIAALFAYRRILLCLNAAIPADAFTSSTATIYVYLDKPPNCTNQYCDLGYWSNAFDIQVQPGP